MTYEFKLPDIGEGVVEGEVVRWLVAEGDMVREDQPLVEIMTDKATVEIPAPRAGRVAKRMYAEGQICPVGKVLITIETDPDVTAGTGASAPATTTSAAAVSLPTTSTSTSRNTDKSGGGHDVGVLATPATRRLARDAGVDIRLVTGTGPAGRITSEDVRAHGNGGATTGTSPAAAAPVAGGTTTAREAGDVRLPFRGVRKKIAERLVHSKQTAAHFTYVEEIDCTELVRVRAETNARLTATTPGRKLSFLPFIIKATVGALRKFPQLNATLDDAAGEIVQRAAHHIGLATATDSGLIVPVIRDAGSRSLQALAAEIDRLAEATRSGKATREDLSGSTFTITSLGVLGGLLATPIINFPEVAILGVHKISKRPAVVDGALAVRDMMNLSISVDHRVVDGYEAAQFVAAIKATLENPAALLATLE